MVAAKGSAAIPKTEGTITYQHGFRRIQPTKKGMHTACATQSTGTRTSEMRDGEEFMRTEPRPVNPDSAGNPNGVPVLQRLAIGSDMPPGDYILQLLVTDKRNSRNKEGFAAQTLSFTVVKD